MSTPSAGTPPARRPSGPGQFSPFAWWSLGLGVAGLLLFIYFVPAISAVLAGVLTVRHVRRWPGYYRGLAMGWAGVVMGLLSIALGITAWVLRATA